MSVTRNTFFMAITTATKMLSGIFVFVIMAKVLGPHDFGLVTYSFTLASLFVLIVDYGFSQQLLRDIGAHPEGVNDVMGRVLVTKVMLSIATLVICAVYLYFFPKNRTTEMVFWLLLASSILASFCEFLNTAFRGIGQFKKETNIATAGSLIHFVLLLGVLLIKPDVMLVAFAFIFSRMIFLAISWGAYKNHIGNIHIRVGFHREQLSNTLMSGFPYATDAGFTNLFYQVDTIIIAHYLGFVSLGLYQAVTKWLQGAMQFAPVLANVYIPKIASIFEDKAELSRISDVFNTKMLILGVLGGGGFLIFGARLSAYIYGDAYAQASALWPAVGVLMFLRYLSGAQGTLLMAAGFQKVRVTTQFFALILLLSTAPFLLKMFGLMGMVIALQLNVFFVFCIYTISLIKHKQANGFTRSKLLLSLVVLVIGEAFQWNQYAHT